MTSTYDVESDDYCWLNLTNEDIKGMANPLLEEGVFSNDNFHLRVVSIFQNPRYLYWTAKVLLGIDLLPMQVVVLQELWTKSFPMYLASRGYGKSWLLAVYAILRGLLVPESKIVIVGAAFRQSKVIFEYMETLWRNAPLYRSLCSDRSGPRRDIDRCTLRMNESWAIAVPLGCMTGDTLITTDSGISCLENLDDYEGSVYSDTDFKDVGFFYDNGVYPIHKITTNIDVNYRATPNHKMKVVRDNKIVWCRTDEIKVGDRILINRSERWFTPSFDCT